MASFDLNSSKHQQYVTSFLIKIPNDYLAPDQVDHFQLLKVPAGF